MHRYLIFLALLLVVQVHSMDIAEIPSSSRTTSLPTIKGLTIDHIAIALAGSVTFESREWSIAKEGDQAILQRFFSPTNRGKTELKLLEEGFSSIPYDVDSLGYLRMCVCLINDNFIDEEGFNIPYQTFLVTQLTAEELTLPEVIAKQLSVSFDQHSADYKNSIHKTRYLENCNKLVQATIQLIVDEEQKAEALREHQKLMQAMATLSKASDIEEQLT